MLQVVCCMIVDTILTGVGSAASSTASATRSNSAAATSEGTEAVLPSAPSQPFPDDKKRMNARIAQLRLAGKAAVLELCRQLGITSNSNNLTVMIHALADKEEENRQQQEQHPGNGCQLC